MTRTLALTALLAVSACAARRGPDDVLDRFLAAEQTGRYEESWRLLATTDQSARTVEAYAKDHYDAGVPWLISSREARAKLVGEQPGDGVTVFAVAITRPDVRQVAAVLPELPTVETAGEMEGLIAALVPVVRERGVPTITDELTWTLRQEGRHWRVWLGIAEQDAALAASVAAHRARRSGDEAAERAALSTLMASPPDPAGAVRRLQDEHRTRWEALSAP